MTETNKETNIARIIYDAYPQADLLPIDPDQDCRSLQSLLSKVTAENIGDGLFKFMVVEIVEGSESTLRWSDSGSGAGQGGCRGRAAGSPSRECQPKQYNSVNFERRLKNVRYSKRYRWTGIFAGRSKR